ncbi:UPF0056 inner membrane protein [Roseomonas fluvialis]|uniref:UPF0056 membrane protein n=1 Tax=Roseomonas fluvialis TaxID=1750527 RepID=A0ABN6NYJ5_9PROT|nr:UPF0056 inner membrane protein [Roseomonas fluvialis]
MMGVDDAFALKFLGALIAIMNPLGGLPLFLALTAGLGAQAQRGIALQVVLCIAAIGAVAAMAGTPILAFFGIGIHDLQVAGGLMVLKIAFDMLAGTPGDAPASPDGAAGGVAFYPLAFPMLMGPGAITTMIIFAGRAQHRGADWAACVVAFGAALLCVAVVLLLGARFGALLSDTARVIMTRVMGLILAAIAVQMVVDGLRALLPGLG